MGFEPTIAMFERAKTVHILDRAATVLGLQDLYSHEMLGTPSYINLSYALKTKLQCKIYKGNY
jgi:hypothetical protein